jgi:glycerol-3-phosphate dehydrogenase
MRLHPDLPYIAAEVVWAARAEMARTVEDVLARHTRALFLNAAAAKAMAEPVARLLAAELGRDEGWVGCQVREFCELAGQYMVV